MSHHTLPSVESVALSETRQFLVGVQITPTVTGDPLRNCSWHVFMAYVEGGLSATSFFFFKVLEICYL